MNSDFFDWGLQTPLTPIECRGMGHIVYINLHVSQYAFRKQLPVDDLLPGP